METMLLKRVKLKMVKVDSFKKDGEVIEYAKVFVANGISSIPMKCKLTVGKELENLDLRDNIFTLEVEPKLFKGDKGEILGAGRIVNFTKEG